MDVRGIANSLTTIVNPNQTVRFLRSIGYTIGEGRKQIPKYADPINGSGQIQALDTNDLQQIDGLNIESNMRTIYVRGVLASVIRPEGVGGDLVQTFDSSGNIFETWLVTKVLERWPDWTKALIVLQSK